MIVQAILDIFKALIEFVLGLLPSIPSFSQSILDGIQYFTALVIGVVSLIAYLEGATLMVFVLTAIFILLNFDNLYKLALWFWHKVRG